MRLINLMNLKTIVAGSSKRPMYRKPKAILILLPEKIIGLDSILPVAMELRRETPDANITFLFLNRRATAAFERNYALRRGADTTGRIDVLSAGDGTVGAKIQAGLRLLFWAFKSFINPTLLLSPADLGRFPLNILAFAARRGGGAACVYCKTSYPGNTALNRAQDFKARGRDMRWRDAGDAFLVYHPTQIEDYAGYGMAQPTLLGTPRDMPSWRAYLKRLAKEEGIYDENGEDMTGLKGPVFVIFYPGPLAIPHQIDDPRDALMLILATVAVEAPHATIIIKPHPTICDIDLLRRDLADRASLKVRISHAHPQLLMQVAAVAISTNASNVMYDCYLEKVPVIETTKYRPDILALGESLYPNPGRLGCPDEASLRIAIRKAVSSPETLPKPDIASLWWPKPDSLSAVLWGG